MKILIIGATGLLGSRLAPYLKEKYKEVVTCGYSNSDGDRNDFTILDSSIDYLNRVKPNVIINLICLSNVDQCETNPDLAYRLNTLVIENLVKWTESSPDTRIVQISTDHLYDNKKYNSESDLVLKNTYALTKLFAEKLLRNTNSIILRTNFFGKSFSENRKSFSDWIVDSINRNEKIRLINDVIFNPVSIEILCDCISIVLSSDKTGTYNIGSKEGMDKLTFAKEIAKRKSLILRKFEPCSVDDLGLSALRPKGMLMNCSLFEETFNYKFPRLIDAIAQAEI